MRPVLELNEGFSRKLFYLMSDDTSLSLSLCASLWPSWASRRGPREGAAGEEALLKASWGVVGRLWEGLGYFVALFTLRNLYRYIVKARDN